MSPWPDGMAPGKIFPPLSDAEIERNVVRAVAQGIARIKPGERIAVERVKRETDWDPLFMLIYTNPEDEPRRRRLGRWLGRRL